MKNNFDRLIRDIEEGIIVLDQTGTIVHINPKANLILDLKKDYNSLKYVSLIEDDKQNNDEFNEMIIQAVSEPNTVHKRRIKYKLSNGELKTLYIASSLLINDDKSIGGVILSFDDITRQEDLEKAGNDAAITFVFLIGILCFWIFAYALWNENQSMFHYTLFGKFIPLSALLATPVGMKVFGYSLTDLGLKTKGIKKYIIQDLILTIIAFIILCVVKLIVIKNYPEYNFYCANNSFFDFRKFSLYDYFEYVVVVLLQEFVSRGLAYESVRRLFLTRYCESKANNIAVIISSIYFAALHVAYGPVYMIGAFVLLSLFGFIYNKQRTIFGLCIPHYVLGLMIAILGFVEF